MTRPAKILDRSAAPAQLPLPRQSEWAIRLGAGAISLVFLTLLTRVADDPALWVGIFIHVLVAALFWGRSLAVFVGPMAGAAAGPDGILLHFRSPKAPHLVPWTMVAGISVQPVWTDKSPRVCVALLSHGDPPLDAVVLATCWHYQAVEFLRTAARFRALQREQPAVGQWFAFSGLSWRRTSFRFSAALVAVGLLVLPLTHEPLLCTTIVGLYGVIVYATMQLRLRHHESMGFAWTGHRWRASEDGNTRTHEGHPYRTPFRLGGERQATSAALPKLYRAWGEALLSAEDRFDAAERQAPAPASQE